jgi:hypothetical protein
MKALYDGFDLCSPTTSVSMTINGPAPIILAMYLNTAIEQQLAKFVDDNQRQLSAAEIDSIRSWSLENIRGTVQYPWHGAGRHSERRPGAEYLHILHRICPQDDGRYPAILHRSSHP